MSTSPDAELGGARTHVLGVIDAFRELGWEVLPFIVGDRVPRAWRSEGSERALRSRLHRRLAADLLRLAIGQYAARQAYALQGGRVDWAYERSAAFQSLGRRFQRGGVPWILEVNAPLYLESTVDRKSVALSWLARALEFRAYRNCDVIVAVSETLKRFLIAEAGVPEAKIVVSPSATNPDFYDPRRHEPQRIFDGPTLIYVGWLVPWQGLPLLLRAMRAAAEHGAAWNLVIVGNGPSRAEWKALTIRLGLKRRVAFVGVVERQEVPRYIAGADIGYSGPTPLKLGAMYHSPLKLYEYMAMAKPVVAAAYDDALTAVTEGVTGWLFEPGNQPGLTRALLDAHSGLNQLPEMGEHAREQVRQAHTWHERVQALIGEVEARLGERGGREWAAPQDPGG